MKVDINSLEQYIKGLEGERDKFRTALSRIAESDVGMSPVAKRLIEVAAKALRMVE